MIKNLLLSLIIIVFAFVLTTLVDENSISYGSLSLFLLCTIIIFFLQWIVFIPSYFLSTEHFFDLTGSVTFITVSILAFLMNDSKNLRQFIVLVLIMIWALRLGSFLFLRIRKAGEDSRFTIIKKNDTWKNLKISVKIYTKYQNYEPSVPIYVALRDLCLSQ